MIRTSLRVQRAAAFAVFAAFTILPSISAMPAAADTPSLMRGTLDEVRREAQSIRIELAQMSPDSAIQLNRRLDELERLIQRLTDKIESLDAQQREFAREFDRFKNDTDFRLEKAARPPRRDAAARPPRNPASAAQPRRRRRRGSAAAAAGTPRGSGAAAAARGPAGRRHRPRSIRARARATAPRRLQGGRGRARRIRAPLSQRSARRQCLLLARRELLRPSALPGC